MVSLCSHSCWYHSQDLKTSLSLLHLLNIQCSSRHRNPKAPDLTIDSDTLLEQKGTAMDWENIFIFADKRLVITEYIF